MKVDITNLRNIKSMSFEIPDGKVSLLTGSSGSGKSSIAASIRMMLVLVQIQVR